MLNKPTLFYAPSCEFCQIVAEEAVPIMLQQNVPLIVRMPTLKEKMEIVRVPALFIPAGYLSLEKPHLFFGGGIPQWLRQLTHGTSDPNN
jgi:hypothetical protein